MKSRKYTTALMTLALLIYDWSAGLGWHPAGHGEPAKKPQADNTAARKPYDLQFIDMMNAHHRTGIKMAKMPETKASHAELKGFAQKMIDDQQNDIKKLNGERNLVVRLRSPLFT